MYETAKYTRKERKSKKIEFISAFKDGRYYYGVLFFLLCFFIMAPFFKDSRGSEAFFGLSLVFALIFCILSICEKKRLVTTSLILSLPLVAKSLQPFFSDYYYVESLIFSLSGAFFIAFMLYIIIRDIFHSNVVDGPIIAGSISAYILLGLLFSFIYLTLEQIQPNSFKFSPSSNAGSEQVREMIYFSFITLSTVGYGDITPLSLHAKIFSSLEAVFAQLYLTVLVARLVGLSVVHSHNKRRFFK